jgi:hypothetical protein
LTQIGNFGQKIKPSGNPERFPRQRESSQTSNRKRNRKKQKIKENRKRKEKKTDKKQKLKERSQTSNNLNVTVYPIKGSKFSLSKLFPQPSPETNWCAHTITTTTTTSSTTTSTVTKAMTISLITTPTLKSN